MMVADVFRTPSQGRLASYRERLLKRMSKPTTPTRGGKFVAVISGMLTAFSIVGLVAGFALAFYLLMLKLDPSDLPFRLPMGSSMYENLAAGAVFFVLELLAIVGVLRMYEQFRLDSLHRGQIFDLHEDVRDLIWLVDAARIEFAEELDAHFTKETLYDVDFWELNRRVAGMRAAFVLGSLCDPDHTTYIQNISNRVLAALDRKVGASYDATAAAEAFQAAKDGPGVDRELSRLFDATDPTIQSLHDLANVLELARKAI